MTPAELDSQPVTAWNDLPPVIDRELKIPFGDLPHQWLTPHIAEHVLGQLFVKHPKMFGDYLLIAMQDG